MFDSGTLTCRVSGLLLNYNSQWRWEGGAKGACALGSTV